VTCKNNQKRNKAVDFYSSSLDLFRSSLVSDLFLLQICFFLFFSPSVSGGRRYVQGAAGGGASVVSVQLPVAGSGLGEDEGLRAARRRSRWLREGSVRVGENGDEEGSRGCLVGLWGLDYREGGWRLWSREREACPELSGFSGSWPQRRGGGRPVSVFDGGEVSGRERGRLVREKISGEGGPAVSFFVVKAGGRRLGVGFSGDGFFFFFGGGGVCVFCGVLLVFGKARGQPCPAAGRRSRKFKTPK
jgi:hypothetical protein